MADNKCNRQFWIFDYNLVSLLLILSEIIKYKFDHDDIIAIKYGLTSTSDEKDIWFDYRLTGIESIFLKFARDDDNRDIIFIDLTTKIELSDKIDFAIYVTDNFKLDSLNFNEGL